jgi:predicted neuraminidase
METFVFMKAISRISLNKDNLFGAQKQKIKDNPLLHLNCKETEIFVSMTLSKTVHFLMTVLEKDNNPID